MDFVDPKGKVFCEGCSGMGRPSGGVRTQRHVSKVHISFELPEGWVLAPDDGSLLCGVCASKLKRKWERRTKPEGTPLADAVIESNNLLGTAEGVSPKDISRRYSSQQ